MIHLDKVPGKEAAYQDRKHLDNNDSAANKHLRRKLQQSLNEESRFHSRQLLGWYHRRKEGETFITTRR